jgi:hypothetical protein
VTRIGAIILLSAVYLAAPISATAQDVQNGPIQDITDTDIFGEQLYSKRKAILLSLAVPGLGHAYTGNWERARIYFATEAVTWAGFAAFRIFGSWKADDFRTLAADRAGVILQGQNDAYFKQVGIFGTSDEHNQDQRLTLRDRGRTYTGNDTWAWVSDVDRLQYQSIRKSSQRARVRSYYLVGLAIAARIASAVDIRRTLPSASNLPTLNLYMPPEGGVWMMARLSF